MEFKEFVKQNKIYLAVFLTILIVVVGAFTMSSHDFDLQEEDEPVNGEDTNETEEQDPSFTEVSADEIEGDIEEVRLTDTGADPSRPIISEEDGIEYVNEREEEILVEFDRDEFGGAAEIGEGQTLILDEDESAIMDLDSITYYVYNPTDEEVDVREEGGSINVQ